MQNYASDTQTLLKELHLVETAMKMRGMKPPPISSLTTKNNKAFRAFQKKYFYNPAAFVLECIDWSKVTGSKGPAPYQLEVLDAIVEHHRVSVRGPHGLGKTALSSWVVIWFTLTRAERPEDFKVLTTASAWRQLTIYLWPEIHKWLRFVRWDVVGRSPLVEGEELLMRSIKFRNGLADAVASNSPGKIEGGHAPQMLYLFDESKEIPDGIFNAAEGAFSQADPSDPNAVKEAYAVAVSTPGDTAGRFYEIHQDRSRFSGWWVRHVTLEETIAAGQNTWHWVEGRKREWGADTAIFANRVLGQFAASDKDAVIPLTWVEKANERWLGLFAELGVTKYEPELAQQGFYSHLLAKAGLKLDAVGVDVAYEGEDKTAFALRFQTIIAEVRKFSKEDTQVSAGRVGALVNALAVPDDGAVDIHPVAGVSDMTVLAQLGYALLPKEQLPPAIVDIIGWGAGVFDDLKHKGFNAFAFNAATSSYLYDITGELGFGNLRAEAWYNLRVMLDPANGYNVLLPPDPDLIADLTMPTLKPRAGGRLYIQDKESIRKERLKRFGRASSTDVGDAVVQAFYRIPKRKTPDGSGDIPSSGGQGYNGVTTNASPSAPQAQVAVLPRERGSVPL
jgi:hypothetical protein